MDHSRVVPSEWYRHDGQYDKGKIHCSCRMCNPYRLDGVPNINTIRKLEAWNNTFHDAVV